MREVRVTRSTRIVAPPPRVWLFAADTDRIGRVAGLAAVTSTKPINRGLARFSVRQRLGPFTFQYEEIPAVFAINEFLNLRRETRAGPFGAFCYDVKLAAAGAEQTDVVVELSLGASPF